MASAASASSSTISSRMRAPFASEPAPSAVDLDRHEAASGRRGARRAGCACGPPSSIRRRPREVVDAGHARGRRPGRSRRRAAGPCRRRRRCPSRSAPRRRRLTVSGMLYWPRVSAFSGASCMPSTGAPTPPVRRARPAPSSSSGAVPPFCASCCSDGRSAGRGVDRPLLAVAEHVEMDHVAGLGLGDLAASSRCWTSPARR